MTFTPITGLTTGGTEVLINNAVLDTDDCSDAFSGAVLSALWGNVSAGGGFVYPDPLRGALLLSTPMNPGASAGVRTVATLTHCDASIVAEIVRNSTNSGGTIMPVRLILGVSATTTFRLELETDSAGRVVLVVRATQAGANSLRFVRTLTETEIANPVSLRLLRYGNRVIGFFNQDVVVDTTWVANAATVEISCANDAVEDSQVASYLSTYVRTPVVVFGTEPARTVRSRIGTRLIVSSPPTDLPGIVDVTLVGCTTSATLVQAFTYALGERYEIRAGHDAKLIVLDDATLRNT